MTSRSSIAMKLTIAGAIACGAAITSHAASLDDDGYVVKTQSARDLKPMPGNPAGQRPHVTLNPSSGVVPIGSPITFQITSSVNGYGHLYVMSASGRAQVWMENVPIAAGERLYFPTGGLGIKAAAPAGREDLMLIVTRERIDGFFGYKSTRSPRVVEHDHQSFKQALTEKFTEMPRRQWGYARTSVRVVNRGPSAPGGNWGWGPAQGQSNYWADQWETD
jgi:hypothetical protein